ncbi:hypothetical protein HYALB_00000124 [Hymenoscyphus albidus]|uniref:Uncharacterized protein n=1 Tax=Hymenoscyphus albidus TaxID=595503 RepID=A0A9N9LIT1_9HELO|nr:hypothetical protein HYALB_00000124 [Hymenoscyphus albidus]
MSLQEDSYPPNPNPNPIPIKSDFELSRPPSIDAMSPPGGLVLQPLVNELLAQIHNPSAQNQLESPEPLEEDMSFNQNQFTTPISQPAPQRAPKSRQKPQSLTMEERLQMMPEKRPLPWRAGVEPGAENETGGDSRRKQIRFGCLLATRGEVQTTPCNSCSNGRGKFELCVALEGFFKGACASCQLSGRPNRCSIKVQDDNPESSPVNTPGAGGVSLINSHDMLVHQSTSEGPKAKRRRKDKDTVPEWESQRPQWEQELGNSHARQQMKDIVQRPWATVNTQMPVPPNPMMMNGVGVGTRSAVPEGGDRAGWATVNQQTSPSSGNQMFGNGNGNGGESNGSNFKLEQGGREREDTLANEEGSAVLIDTLPKHKQRQVYGLVSGLQGGIDHLQRELNSLRRALGIEE